MRFIFALTVMIVLSTSALAQDQTIDNAPPTDEYNNVPPGLLMSEDVKERAPVPVADEDIMTIQDLMAAYRRGEYDLVAKHLIPVANSNYPQMEELLGIMYRRGQGVPLDAAKAADWLTRAAEANRPIAQHHLGDMYFKGEGVTQDTVQALMWLHIASVYYQSGPEKEQVAKDRDTVAAQLSRRDRQRAYDLAREWLEKKNETLLLDRLER